MTLAGRTLIVTRPARDAGELSSGLRGLGATVIEAPAIEIVELEDTTELDRAIRSLAAGEFAWVSFTSPRAVDAVRQWRYEPSDLGPTVATITVRFMLDKGKGADKP